MSKNKAIIVVGEDGAKIALPNGEIVSVDRDEDSVSAAETVLSGLGIDVEFRDELEDS